jgi:polysaccharide export outer membrane protein
MTRILAAAAILLGVGPACAPRAASRPAVAPSPSAPPSPGVPALPANPGPSATPPAARPAEYRVGPGDVLDITVLGQADLTRTATIQPMGAITLPLVNDVPVTGLTVGEVQRKLTTLLARDFLVNPQVEVRVKEYQSQFVLVLGEVNAPGRKPLRGSTRLIDLLVEAGGFNARASGEIYITRADGSFEGGNRSLRLRLGGQLTAQEYVNLELPLRHGDIVTALAKSYVNVEGEVQRPGRFAIEGDLTVSGAIAMAGGLTRFGSSDVKLRRIDPQTGRVTVVEVDLKAVRSGKQPDPAIANNDVVSVPRRLF